MPVLISFIPWVLFWVLLGMGKSEPAALAGFVGALIININSWLKGQAPKILNIGTLAFFLILTLVALFSDLNKFGPWTTLWSNLSLTLIVFISIVIGMPFTLQYAREQVPKEYWNSPEFIHANYVISWVWLIAFLFTLFVPIARILGANLAPWSGGLVSILCFSAAGKFTHWYTGRDKNK